MPTKHIIHKKDQILPKIRYIIDESEGCSINEFNTSWVEVQVFDRDKKNIALNKTITSNFVPLQDVTGQSDLRTITNGKISLGEWVSCNISIISTNKPKIIIDLGAEYEISQIVFYHGWWTKRYYKNIVSVANDLTNPICVYDYTKDSLVYEDRNIPMIINFT